MSIDASDGFLFALRVLDSLDVAYDPDNVSRCLFDVACGNRSLFNNPEDEVQRQSCGLNLPLSEAERDEKLPFFRDHQDLIEATNQQTANLILAGLQQR